MTYLNALGRREREQIARAPVAGHEHAHDVLVGRVALESARAQQLDERLDLARRRLDAKLVGAAARLLERIDGTGGRDALLVHDDDVVAGVLDVGQQVRRQNQVDAFVVRQIADEIEHLVAPFRVHAVGRLVEEQQIGIVNERLRQLDPLLHAGRVGFDIAVARLAEADVEQHLVRALHRVDARQAGQLAAVRHEGDRVHAGNVPVGLRHVADARANLERRSGDVETEHAHLSAIGRDETEQRFDHRALPGAVRAGRSKAAAGDRGRRVAQRRVPAVHRGYGVERDDRGDAARLSHALDLYAPAYQSVPRRPSASARSRMNAITLAICSSSGMPSDSAPAIRSSRYTPRANALSFIRFFTELTSRSSTLFVGRTSDAAVTKPASSSHAKSVFSSRLSRDTPVISCACERIARIIQSGYPFSWRISLPLFG